MRRAGYLVLLILLTSVLLIACSATPTQKAETIPAASVEPKIETALEVEPTDIEDQSSTDSSFATTFSDPVTAAGDVVIVSGRVLDVNGNPLEGASVQFWQTDVSGVYDHPGDRGTDNRDLGFQFYGRAVTDAEGTYIFRTIHPGRYEPRPPHIHFKVFWNGTELLTSQIYFADVGSEGGTSSGINTDPLLMSVEQEIGNDGTTLGMGTFDIIVDTGAGAGSLSLTPGQGEGPYYPVVNVEDFDNDLASVSN